MCFVCVVGLIVLSVCLVVLFDSLGACLCCCVFVMFGWLIWLCVCLFVCCVSVVVVCWS